MVSFGSLYFALPCVSFASCNLAKAQLLQVVICLVRGICVAEYRRVSRRSTSYTFYLLAAGDDV